MLLHFNLARYYWYGVALGLRSLIAGNWLQGTKKVVNPIDYWRCVEIPWVFEALKPQPGERILDVGSPKLPALYLVKHFSCFVYATDIWDYFVNEYKTFAKLEQLGPLLGNRYFLHVEDGTQLRYPNSFFDKAYSISVLEHIPNNGDTLAIRELARVLKPGGILAITTPLRKSYSELFVNRDVYGRKLAGEKVFFSRYYDKDALHQRLVLPSGLKLVTMKLFAESWEFYSKLYLKVPYGLRIFMFNFHPLLARLFVRPVQNIREYGVACLLFQKL